MADSWQDALAGLRDSLPEGEEKVEATVEKPAAKPKLQVVFEKKGRGGKWVTIIAGFTESQDQIDELAKTLKKKLGIGGSSRGREILLQGDKRIEVTQLLKGLGYKV